MSNTDKVVYAKNPSLLTLKGQIAIHFLDGAVIEGDFAAQDAFNIFLTVDNEPMMVPRSQIRFIKGSQEQQIEEDTSQDAFFGTGPTEVEDAVQDDFFEPKPDPIEIEDAPGDAFFGTEPISVERVDTLRAETEEIAIPHQFEEKDDDGTIILESTDELFSEITGTEEEEEDDDDDGTLVLYPEGDDDDDDGTIILESTDELFYKITGTEEEEEEEDDDDDDDDDDDNDLDMTILLNEPVELPLELGEDEVTVVLDKQNIPEISATLICIGGPHTGIEFQLTSGITTMGRASDNAVVLSNDKEISRHHAIIVQESGKFVVQDQNSLNGTFINDEQVTTPHYLEDNDTILVGLSKFTYKEE